MLELPRSATNNAGGITRGAVRRRQRVARSPARRSGKPPLIPLRELVTMERAPRPTKAFITRISCPCPHLRHWRYRRHGGKSIYAIQAMNKALGKLDTRNSAAAGASLKIFQRHAALHRSRARHQVGRRWHITIEVFRDLGTAFAACLVLIYVLMVGWFARS